MNMHRRWRAGRTTGRISAGRLPRGLVADRRWLRLPATLVVAALAAMMLGIMPFNMPSAHAAVCDPNAGNPVACENSLPGSPPSEWDASQPGPNGPTIQGFADPYSVNVGQTVNFKIQSAAASYTVDIYRMGYYGGNGARKIASVTPNISVTKLQPSCNTNTSTGLVDCGNWGVSASWAVPATAVSGVYFAHISRTDGSSDDSQIPFVVRNDASHAAIVFKTSDTTWQAYNDWGGYSLYAGNASNTANSGLAPGRAQMVSYNRPFATRCSTPNGRDFFFANEFPMVRFLEKNGYDVSYVGSGNVDADTGGTMLKQHKVFMSVGHDEYWSGNERINVQAARDAGVNLAFFSGNSVFWKTRWVSSQYGNEAYRTLVTYKESLDAARTDPQDPPTWTGTFRDPRFSPPADGGQPENALQGTIYMVNCCSYAMQVPSQYSKLRFWRNTSIANMAAGQTATLPGETLGYEWDEDLDNGFRPAGLIDMSSTTQNVSQLVLDYNQNVGPGSATHHLTLYRAPSGALVFGAGTVQWSWGLDSTHDGDSSNPPSTDMQQATVNLMADMGAQPVTLQSGLVQATASTDHTPPTSTITAPAANANIANGSTVTVTGTATDAGGGVVAGVEVSTNGGSTWHPAVLATGGTGNWSYTWTATGSGSVVIKSRASDDSGNMETPGPGVTVNAGCPCSLFGQNYTPSVTSENDSSAYEMGVKFQPSISGWVAGVRFYKGAGNTGTHTGSLWTDTGTLLATGTYTSETSSGWQSLLFANPVQISANTTYVASTYMPNGHYSADQNLFSNSGLSSPPLTALQTGADGGNGIYRPGGPGFPTSTYQGTSYGVDVIFDTQQPPGAAPAVVDAEPYPGSSSNLVSSHPTITFSKPVVPSTASFTLKDSGGNSVAGSTSFNATDTVATFTPTNQLAAGTTYTGTMSGATDNFNQPLASPYTFSFTTAKAPPANGSCPCSIWTDATQPAVSDSGDVAPAELGVKFKANTDGKILGIRFYKNRNNTGAHTGTLWTAGGTQVATGTFSNESSEGWQQLNFASPVSITAGTEYVASYHTTTGHYSYTSSGLTSDVTNGPLTAIGSSSVGGNGVYAYGTGTFPTSYYNNANYWVDVAYQPNADPNPPAVTSTSPTATATSEQVTTKVTVTFNKQVQAGSPTFTLTDQSGHAVSGSTSLDGSHTVLTFTPSSALSAATTYTASVNGATNVSGVAMTTPHGWSFTTSGAAACPCTLFPSDAVPSAATSGDTSGIELGVRFSPDTNGWISGVRFYKGSGNTGTHTGSLWSSSGTLLAHGTFTNETASGWQTLTFPAAVQVSANQTYIVSYYAPNGHYAADVGYFSNSGSDNSPLHAPQSGSSGGNGTYAYGNSQFPQNTYNGTNYWVDPILWTTQPPDTVAPAVDATNPVSGQTSVAPNIGVRATFNKAVQPSTIQFSLTGPGGTSVQGSASYDSSTNTVTFTPSSPLANSTIYTATVSGAKDAAGVSMTGPYSWTFTTATATPPAGQCPCTIWPDATAPTVTSVNDSSPVELGVKFHSDSSGWITGIRFYKGTANTGTHVGRLWDSSGNLLSQATFTSESVAGWQQVNFATPVAVNANTTYVASYFAPNGGYAADQGAFANAGVDNPPLHALKSGVDGPDGVYLYNSAGGFPTSASTANYWVDVAFTTTAP